MMSGSISSEYVSNAKPIDEMMQISHLTNVKGGLAGAVLINSPEGTRGWGKTAFWRTVAGAVALDRQQGSDSRGRCRNVRRSRLRKRASQNTAGKHRRA